MQRIVVLPTHEGWVVKRPGWPGELLPSRHWAEKTAESMAHEIHQLSGRPACVVLAGDGDDEELARFG